MSMKTHALALSIAAVTALAGCATQQPTGAPATGPDPEILRKLTALGDDANVSLQRLAALRSATNGVTVSDYQPPAELATPISIQWSGPIDGLARKVAELTGYSFEGVFGAAPTVPVIVNISVTNASAFDVLSNAGAQAGAAADIVVRPKSKAIAVKYPPTIRSGGYPVAP